jgi:release factor glutamine methyltransferase
VSPLDAVRGVARELDQAGVPSPRVDAELLVADVLGVSRSELYASKRPLAEAELDRLRELVGRRSAREPLAYVLGEWGFRRLVLAVDARALVPRPETEVLVERCLVHLRGLEVPRVLDVGTGSGAIALAIADEHPGAHVVAVDRSEGALGLARENLARAGLDGRVELRWANLLAGLEGPFDLVVSNPPYVPASDYESLAPEIRLYEPYEAIVGDRVWEQVAHAARNVLVPGSYLVLECGDGQAAKVAEGLAALGYEGTVCTPDLAGTERVVEAASPASTSGSDPAVSAAAMAGSDPGRGRGGQA